MEKNVGRYILRKPNFRQKIIILNSLILPKNQKEGTLWDCEISIMLQNIFKIEGGPFRKLRIFSQSQSAEKLGRGDPLGFSKLQFAVRYQKNLKGGLFGDQKIRKKVAQCRKKFKGGPL